MFVPSNTLIKLGFGTETFNKERIHPELRLNSAHELINYVENIKTNFEKEYTLTNLKKPYFLTETYINDYLTPFANIFGLTYDKLLEIVYNNIEECMHKAFIHHYLSYITFIMDCINNGSYSRLDENLFPDSVYAALRLFKRFHYNECYTVEFECPICYETSNKREFLAFICDCRQCACVNCIKHNFKTHLKTNPGKQFRCLYSNCNAGLSHTILADMVLEKIITNEDFEEYATKRTQRIISENTIMCPICKFTAYSEDKFSAKCPICFFKFCPTCLGNEHKISTPVSMSCDEFKVFKLSDEYIPFALKQLELQKMDEQLHPSINENGKQLSTTRAEKKPMTKQEAIYAVIREEDERNTAEDNLRRQQRENREIRRRLKREEEETIKYMKRHDLKKCPKCKTVLDKFYGCNHMTCSRCGHEFCWICLQPFKKGDSISDHFKNFHKNAEGETWLLTDNQQEARTANFNNAQAEYDREHTREERQQRLEDQLLQQRENEEEEVIAKRLTAERYERLQRRLKEIEEKYDGTHSGNNY
jgi:hypothetical protein